MVILKKFSKYVLLIILFSCSKSPLDVDISGINVDLKVSRFDKEFFMINEKNFNQKNNEFKKIYGEFYQSFLINILNTDTADLNIQYKCLDFTQNFDIRKLYNEVQANFKTIDPEIQKLNKAFRYYKYYFPKKPIPRIITFISGFNSKIATSDSVLGISLEMYLGTENKYYEFLRWAVYRREKMRKEYIPFDAVKGWFMSSYKTNTMNNLMYSMIQYGKILYFMDAMFPEDKDYLKIGFKEEQIIWCQKNEKLIWNKLIDLNLFFSKTIEIQKYLIEAPFTKGMPKKSPGQVVLWVGWQIVRKYMKQNPNITIQELLNSPINEQEFLFKSKYKPI